MSDAAKFVSILMLCRVMAVFTQLRSGINLAFSVQIRPVATGWHSGAMYPQIFCAPQSFVVP